LQLTIEKLIYGGDGLARLPAGERGRGKAVFMPFVLPGEAVEAAVVEDKPGFARARLEKILVASTQRAEPQCRYFQRCGGCHYQHARYEQQLAIKAEILKENFRRIAKVELARELEVHASPAWNYRNRSRLRVQAAPEFAIGYHKFGSRELLSVEECPISSPLINRAISAVWKLGRAGMGTEVGEIEFLVDAEDSHVLVEVSIRHEGETKNTTAKKRKSPATKQVKDRTAQDTDKLALQDWAAALKIELPQLAGVALEPHRRASLNTDSRGDRRRAIYGMDHLTYQTQRASYRVSAGSFFQVNRYLTDELVEIVARTFSGEKAVDLYAGVGLFSTVLAPRFGHIEAVECAQSSFADLQYNSPANVQAVHTSVAQYLRAKAGKQGFDFVVVDPPRSGLGEAVLRDLVRLGAPRIAYVSCDPATLARDLKDLLAAGYRIEEAHLVDLFPQTYHLESVLQLVR
jgi:23S rRNA (uracil1939-C5)-methyltransferase